MYSDSMGSIQAAIKKLLKQGHIIFAEHVDNGKNKKTYSITDLGKKHFMNWLITPIKSGLTPNKMLTKLYFIGMLSSEERGPLITSYIDMLHKKMETLASVQQKAKNVVLKDELKDIAYFQLETIQLSIDTLQFEIDWYNALIVKFNT
jgi:DNA-binding PadR family transcriptional regulator